MEHPIFIHARSSAASAFAERCIGISVSESLDNSSGEEALEMFVVDVATNLLLTGHRLAYGGDFRGGGFAELLSYTAYRYKTLSPSTPLIDQYLAYPITQQLTTEMEVSSIEKSVRLIRGALTFQEKDIASFASLWSRSLSEVRHLMAMKTDARILMAGKTTEYFGKIPGLIEEARMTLEQDKPLYLIGCFNGATRQVIDALQGKSFNYMNDDFHRSHEYLQFKFDHNHRYRNDKINVQEEEKFFMNYGLEKLSERNGLTIEENKILFYSEDKTEVMFYLFKGLRNSQQL